MLSQAVLAAALIASAAQAVDVAFVGDKNCTGQVLFGRHSIPSEIPCYSLQHHDNFKSVALSKFDTNQVVRFFTDNSCQQEVHSATNNGECFSPDATVGSFLVESSATQSLAARKAAETDIALRLSNYAGTNITDPYNIDLTNGVITTAGLTLVVASATYNFATGIQACYELVNGKDDTVTERDCIGPVLSAIAAYAGGALIHFGAPKIGETVTRYWDALYGRFLNFKRSEYKRSVSPALDAFDSLHVRDDMPHLGNFSHAGFLEREFANGVQHSPIMATRDAHGNEWHLAAFEHPESGEAIYHIHTAEETKLARRSQVVEERGTAEYAYNVLRWNNGGIDFAVCSYNADQPATGYSDKTAPQLYSTILDQLNCLASPDTLLNAQAYLIDLYNLNTVLKGAVTMQPYVGNTQAPIRCSTSTGNLNQNCVIA